MTDRWPRDMHDIPEIDMEEYWKGIFAACPDKGDFSWEADLDHDLYGTFGSRAEERGW